MHYKWLLAVISIILIGIIFVMMNTKESYSNFNYNDGFNRNSKRKRSCGNYHIKSYNLV